MKLAILFWIYKDLAICVERAKRLRRLNKGVPIYVLFGGDLAEADRFAEGLGGLVDDFYAFPRAETPTWKWLQGDQLISQWHRDRGRSLEWDTFFIAQWDLLTFSPLRELCRHLREDELLLPGLRPIREVKDWWWWVREGSDEQRDYSAFCAKMADEGLLPDDPLCCNFLTAALPRRFLDRYAEISQPDLGFLEYKMPMYAQAWGFGFCRDHPFNPVWRGERRYNRIERYFHTFHAEKDAVPRATVRLNTLLPWGRRVFHPFATPYP